MIGIKEIMGLLPHRYPFLLVDRILEFEENAWLSCIKNVTFNEPFFMGHFPGNPIMPGVLTIEAMAQAAGVLAYKSGVQGSKVYFMSIEKAKFRRPVVPGDTLKIDIRVIHQRSSVWKFSGTTTVDGNVVSEAEFTAMITDKEI